MGSTLPNAVTSGMISAGFGGSRTRKPAKLVTILVGKPTSPDASTMPVAFPRRAQRLFQAIIEQLAVVDEQYQQFVQQHVDPLLGKTRHSQLQEMLGQEPAALSRDELRVG